MGDDNRKVAAARAVHELQHKGVAGMDSSFMVMLAMDWYTGLGDLDRAFETAFKSLEHSGHAGTSGPWAAMWLPEMRPFHRDPRFQTLCARMGLFDYWNAYGPPDNCELGDGKLICH